MTIHPYSLPILYLLSSGICFILHKMKSWAFLSISLLLLISAVIFGLVNPGMGNFAHFLLLILLPIQFINLIFYVFVEKSGELNRMPSKYEVPFPLKRGKLTIKDIRRGISLIGAAGSGKTESVIYNLMLHLSKFGFSGVLHDYKNFELTEMAYPLFKSEKPNFFIISFDQVYNKVNPIASHYLPDEESVNEISRVLLENLLEQKESGAVGSSKFFNDAVEGLIGGIIWKLKTNFPEFCTIPHLIALYQQLTTNQLVKFLSSDIISMAMANAFISGKDSERQLAGVKSTLSNAFKKISTQRIFMALSADEVPLNVNDPKNPIVISLVNNPKFETSYSPIIATILHSITKQMCVRNQHPSFLLMEEAPTIRLLNMHRIPATLRSYDISTIYVMQDKVQNDIMYGDKVSKAILGNLSNQFFGKVNDPDTAKYYERFFEIVKKETKSVHQSETLRFDTSVTKGEKEVAKIRAEIFFKLKPGEFITFADGKDKRAYFKIPNIPRGLPEPAKSYSKEDLMENFEQIHLEARSILKRI